MLSLLIWLPLAAALLVAIWPLSAPLRLTPKAIALGLASVVVAIVVVAFRQFDPSHGSMQFQEYIPWLPAIGLSYHLGADGISLPLLALNAVLTWIVILARNGTEPRSRLFFALVFAINGGVTGAFLAQNLLLFVLFYEIELIPAYLAIAIWGSEKREYAATKFLLYTAMSGIVILAASLALGWLATRPQVNFDIDALQTTALPLAIQIPLLIAFLVGFGIKTPLIPFHSWLPDAYVESSPLVAILLGGLLSKLGAYGLLRFCMGLFPEAWSLLAPGLALWAAIGTLYGALAAIAQHDIKRMVAYSSIGHMAYILLACAAATPLSVVGVAAQMVSHGVILAMLFYLVGIVEQKVGTRDLDALNGLLNPIRGLPLTSALLIVGGMASAGIPGLVGFVSEFLIFQGSFPVFPIPTLLAIVATGLTAVYFVILLNRTCFGKLDNLTAYYPRVTGCEQLPALILAALILFLGVQPAWLVKWSEAATGAMVAVIPAPHPPIAAVPAIGTP